MRVQMVVNSDSRSSWVVPKRWVPLSASYIYVYMWIHMNMGVYINIRIRICTYIYISIFSRMQIFMSMYVCRYVGRFGFDMNNATIETQKMLLL